jgi:hypothetical protein
VGAAQTETTELRAPRLEVLLRVLLRVECLSIRLVSICLCHAKEHRRTWKYSIGVLLYGSWSAECCEYFASLRPECREIVPSHGWMACVIRLRMVDLPAPFAPRMAMRESMLIEVSVLATNKKGPNALDTEAQLRVEVVLLTTRVRERDLVEREDGRRELLHVLKPEVERLRLLYLLDETRRLHLVDDLLLGLGLFDEVGVGTSGGDEPECMDE